MPYASPNDVVGRLGRQLTDDECALVLIRLRDVERRILKRIPDLAAKIAAGAVDVQDVVQIEADAVLRLIRNPDGLIAETDGTYAYTRDSALASGRLEITPEEWATLGWVRSNMTILVPVFSDTAAANADLTYNEYAALKFATGG